MTAWIAGAAVVILVIIGIAWARVRSGRSDRRSMESYGHGLAALGDVAKRTGPSASVRVLPRGDLGRTYVRPGPAATRSAGADRTETARRSGSPARAIVPGETISPARRPSVSSPVPGAERSFDDAGAPRAGAGKASLRERGDERSAAETPGRHSRFGAPPGTGAAAGEGTGTDAGPDAGGGSSEGSSPDTSANPAGAPSTTADRLRPTISPDELRRQAAMRKITVGSVAALAVVLILTASVLLTLQGGGHHAGSPPTTTRPGASTSTSTTTTRVTATTAPVVKPISTSGDTATFKAPSGRYTLRFSTTSAACWVGIQPSLGSGTYLWSQTVQAGSSGAYRASGALAVQLGAPAYLSVTVNGIPMRLPSGVTFYNLVFASG